MASFRAGKCLLKLRLKEVKMTQQELANTLELPKSQISAYANNQRKMSLDTAKTIAHTLSCTIEDLYEWKEYE